MICFLPALGITIGLGKKESESDEPSGNGDGKKKKKKKRRRSLVSGVPGAAHDDLDEHDHELDEATQELAAHFDRMPRSTDEDRRRRADESLWRFQDFPGPDQLDSDQGQAFFQANALPSVRAHAALHNTSYTEAFQRLRQQRRESDFRMRRTGDGNLATDTTTEGTDGSDAGGMSDDITSLMKTRVTAAGLFCDSLVAESQKDTCLLKAIEFGPKEIVIISISFYIMLGGMCFLTAGLRLSMLSILCNVCIRADSH